jgi:hypothetical protein
METNYCLFTLLRGNGTKAVQYCCVDKDTQQYCTSALLSIGHRRHVATETIKRDITTTTTTITVIIIISAIVHWPVDLATKIKNLI